MRGFGGVRVAVFGGRVRRCGSARVRRCGGVRVPVRACRGAGRLLGLGAGLSVVGAWLRCRASSLLDVVPSTVPPRRPVVPARRSDLPVGRSTGGLLHSLPLRPCPVGGLGRSISRKVHPGRRAAAPAPSAGRFECWVVVHDSAPWAFGRRVPALDLALGAFGRALEFGLAAGPFGRRALVLDLAAGAFGRRAWMVGGDIGSAPVLGMAPHRPAGPRNGSAAGSDRPASACDRSAVKSGRSAARCRRAASARHSHHAPVVTCPCAVGRRRRAPRRGRCDRRTLASTRSASPAAVSPMPGSRPVQGAPGSARPLARHPSQTPPRGGGARRRAGPGGA
jgi:hypothetical protein